MTAEFDTDAARNARYWARINERIATAPTREKMLALGYTAEMTGGGCMAWQRDLGDGTSISIADDGSDISSAAADREWYVQRQNNLDCEFAGVLSGDGLTLDECVALAAGLPDPRLLPKGKQQTDIPAGLIRWVLQFGLGFHADNSGADYVGRDGTRSLSDALAATYDADIAEAWTQCDDIYTVTVWIWHAMGLLTTAEAFETAPSEGK